MANAQENPTKVRRHSLQVALLFTFLTACQAQASDLHSDFKRLPDTVIAEYFQVSPQAVTACKTQPTQCSKNFVFDEKNYYVSGRSADSPPELAFWHTDKTKFTAVITAFGKLPRFYQFDGATLTDTTARNLQKINTQFGSSKGLSFDLPKVGTTIEVFRYAEPVGRAAFTGGQFTYQKTGLLAPNTLLLTNLCKEYRCQAYATGQDTTTVTISGKDANNPQFTANLIVIGKSKPFYELEIYKNDLQRAETTKMIQTLLKSSSSATTLNDLRKVCAKPENNMQAEYLSCRDAAYSNKDFTIRIVY